MTGVQTCALPISNPFLKPLVSAASEHHGTQGDGNHFFYVGRMASSGAIALVTHHGSRKPGAMLYKAGMERAEANRRKLSPERLKSVVSTSRLMVGFSR